MNLLKQLWKDETGAVYTAEAVILGSVVLTGATVGLSQLKDSVNQELTDLSRAIRSLDQSYSIPAHRGTNHAMSAGSSFVDNVAEDVRSIVEPAEDKSPDSEQRNGNEASVLNPISDDSSI